MLSVIIPVLNEAERIATTVKDVIDRPDVAEVIVVDGGSGDESVQLAKDAGATVLTTQRGRGHQLNVGAAAALSENLLFLHADVTLPVDATRMIEAALRKPGVVGGAFRTWHRAERWRGTAKAALLHLADFRSRYSPLPYGDQGIFTSAKIFRKVGGFPAIPLMEDLAFARALRQCGIVVRLPAAVSVSARRFESAPIYQTALVNVFPLLYYLGVPSTVLARLYGNPR